jgi:DNA-binding NarL/FixJ family response regulator
MAEGRSNAGIAQALVVGEGSVEKHISNIFAKLGLPSRAAATAYAYQHGLV